MLKTLTFVATAFIAALLAAELAIRFFGLFPDERALFDRGFAPAADADDPEPDRLLIHPYLGFSQLPGWRSDRTTAALAEGLFPDTGATDWWREHRETNLFGLHSPIRDYRELPRSAYVVGVFGGSVASDLVTVGGETLRDALARELPDGTGEVAILNFAVGGYKQPQQAIALLEALTLGIRFDLVVELDGFDEVALGGSDAARGHHPIFPSRSHYNGAVNLVTEATSDGRIELQAAIIRSKRRAREWIAQERVLPAASALARAVLGSFALREEMRALELEAALQGSLAGASSEPRTPDLPDPCIGRAGDCLPLIADLWMRSSMWMDAMARAAGARYLHLLQPNQYVEHSKPLSRDERDGAYTPEAEWPTLAAHGYPHLRERGLRLQRAGVSFVDLTPLFADVEETVYIDACCHVNLRGYQRIAEAIASHPVVRARDADRAGADRGRRR